MRHLVTALLGTALLATAPAAIAKPRLAPEAELAEMLKNRVPGEPVSCINLTGVRSSRIIDKTAIVYDAGGTIYVNRPDNADQLDRWDTLVTRLQSNRLCRPDIVRLYDSTSKFETGSVSLGDFIPYRRAR